MQVSCLMKPKLVGLWDTAHDERVEGIWFKNTNRIAI